MPRKTETLNQDIQTANEAYSEGNHSQARVILDIIEARAMVHIAELLSEVAKDLRAINKKLDIFIDKPTILEDAVSKATPATK